MRCFIDIDGVLADFHGAAHALHGKPYIYEQTPWTFYAAWGLSDTAFYAPMGRDFWATIPATIEAAEVLRACEIQYGEQNCCLLTSPCLTPGCVEGKRDWIADHFPRYSSRVLFGSCKEFCAHPGAVLIDDNDSNVARFAAAGGYAILFPRPWNGNRHRKSLGYLQWHLPSANSQPRIDPSAHRCSRPSCGVQ